MKKTVNLLVVIYFVMSTPKTTDGQGSAIGARSTGLAGISSVIEDAWATANNPASLANYGKKSVATFAGQRFLMKETGQYAFAATLPVKKGCLGLVGQFSGFGSFVSQQFHVCYGMTLGRSVTSGLSLVYCLQRAGEASSTLHQVSYHLGTSIKISKSVSLAFSAFNPFQLYFRSRPYATLPSLFSLGLALKYSPDFNLFIELEKELDYSPLVKLGGEYGLKGKVYLRGGIRIWPVAYSFGASIHHRSMLFEVSSWYHPYLGFTPASTLQIDFE